jgi:acyl-CoA hydrolase
LQNARKKGKIERGGKSMEQERFHKPELEKSEGRSITYSRSSTIRVMGVLDANSHGNVHGGVIMRMVDEAAAIVAVRHARRPVVTARVDRFDFLAPAYVGNVVSVHCALNYVGRTSMEVGVEVTAEDLITGEIRKIASSQIIYVALDEKKRPTPVPPLIPADAEEAAIIERARHRRMRMHKVEEELAKMPRETEEKG